MNTNVYLDPDIIRFIADFLLKLADLNTFDQVSIGIRKSLNANYWRHRTSKLLKISIDFTDRTSDWKRAYTKIYHTFGLRRSKKHGGSMDCYINTEYHRFPMILKYLPTDSVTQWMAKKDSKIYKDDIWYNILRYTRFEMVMNYLKTSEYLEFPIEPFKMLLGIGTCPVELLIDVLEEYTNNIFGEVSLETTQEWCNIIATAKLTNLQVLEKSIFVSKYSIATPEELIYIGLTADSPIQVSYFMSLMDLNNLKLNYSNSISSKIPYIAGYAVGKLIIPTYTSEEFQTVLRNKFNFKVDLVVSKSFETAFLEDPRITSEIIITQVLPNLLHSRSTPDIFIGPGLCNLGIDLRLLTDCRLKKYLVPADIGNLINEYPKTFPYSSNTKSPFFKLLTCVSRYPVDLRSKDFGLPGLHYTDACRLTVDKVILRNLVYKRYFFVVSLLLGYNRYPRWIQGTTNLNTKLFNEVIELGRVKRNSSCKLIKQTIQRFLAIINI